MKTLIEQPLKQIDEEIIGRETPLQDLERPKMAFARPEVTWQGSVLTDPLGGSLHP